LFKNRIWSAFATGARPAGTKISTVSGVFMQGLTFDTATGTYFGVNTGDQLIECSTNGKILRQLGLRRYGIRQPVGVATDGSHLFVADEVDDGAPGGRTKGYIFVLAVPR